MTTLKLSGNMKTIPMDAYPVTNDPRKVLQTLLTTAEAEGLRVTKLSYGEGDVISYDAGSAHAKVIDDAMAADCCYIYFGYGRPSDERLAAVRTGKAGSVFFIPCNGCDAISDWAAADGSLLDRAIDSTLDLIHG